MSPKDSQTGRKALRISLIEEREHVLIVKQFMHDYVRYLTSLGFTKVQTTSDSTTGSNGLFKSKKKKHHTVTRSIHTQFYTF